MKSIKNKSIFKFSVRLNSNANNVKLESRLCFIDCLRGFSGQVNQENVNSQNTELHPDTLTTAVIIPIVDFNALYCR